jgi:hypothetical protein
MNVTPRERGIWEQHGQTLMLSVITAVLMFSSKTLWDSNAIQASMIEKINGLSSQVARLEGAVTAMQANYVTRGEFAVHEQRIQNIEAHTRK